MKDFYNIHFLHIKAQIIMLKCHRVKLKYLILVHNFSLFLP